MAPNNALADRSSQKSSTNNTNASSSSSVLDVGIVENRGYGGSTLTKDIIRQDIQDFLKGYHKENSILYSESRSFFTVWTFLTRLPGPTYVDHHPGYLMRGMLYFPMVGTMIGLWISCFYNVAAVTLQLPPIIAACICTASSLWLTGCFHEDGVRFYCFEIHFQYLCIQLWVLNWICFLFHLWVVLIFWMYWNMAFFEKIMLIDRAFAFADLFSSLFQFFLLYVSHRIIYFVPFYLSLSQRNVLFSTYFGFYCGFVDTNWWKQYTIANV